MDRVFLDANVLFSAAYRPDSRLNDLWSMPDTELVTSQYAVEEARRNLLRVKPEDIPHFHHLLGGTVLLPGATADPLLPEGVELAQKDRPILAAAIQAGASHLLTGDKEHFGDLFGKTLRGVLVLTPAKYFSLRESRGLA